MLESIAGAAMDMSAARFSVEYSMAVTKKVMDTQELAAQELLEMLPASPATIRRDITALEQAGKIRKARGRIFLEDIRRAPSYEMRDAMHDEEKKRIGKAAAALVQEDDSIIIDAGTTTLALAENLRDRNHLSVITNSVPVAYAFNATNVNVFLCGGMLEDMALVDDDAVEFFASHQVEKAFIGASGVRGITGLTVVSPFQFAVKRQMVRSAREVYALLDESKFHIMGVNLFADFRELTGIITSKPITNEKLLERLEQEHVKVIYTE